MRCEGPSSSFRCILSDGAGYGGTIITVAGADPKVRALVYVAALQPDVGETTNKLAASVPGMVPISDLKSSKDGFIFVDPTKFTADVASDLPRAQAEFMANSQMPVAAAAFDAPVTVAAWHDKPSYGIIATEDRELNPMLARRMYKRSGANITEIKAGHLVYISHPGAVASVIECMARAESGRRVGKVTRAYTLRLALAALVVATSLAVELASASIGTVKNIVLVHGAITDGSGWRGVYDILTKEGYHVSVVQQPLTGLAEDVAATKRVIDQQDGPVILVGHSIVRAPRPADLCHGC